MHMPDAKRKGLLIVNTGDGKGKTTAALGTILRAWGRGMRPCIIQFMKSETGQWGEVKAARKLEIEWHSLGDGFTWTSKDMDETIAKAQHAWTIAQEKISSNEYDLILLDEFTYPLQFGWINVSDVLTWLSEHKPPRLHVIITGRNAPKEMIGAADLVTEMSLVKHPFEQGILAQPGVEF
jgi:cob(I)alamin adenosyltransferase